VDNYTMNTQQELTKNSHLYRYSRWKAKKRKKTRNGSFHLTKPQKIKYNKFK